MSQVSRFGNALGYLLGFGIVFAIPIYFLWDIIVSLFHNFPSNDSSFRRLYELDHGIIFYIFTCLILLYIVFKAFGIILMFLASFSSRNFLYSAFLLLILVSLSLPVSSYLIIGNHLYPDFHFSLTTMLNYVGIFEIQMLFIVILEAFILDVGIISFLVRVGMYGYLLYIFG